jgi:K+-sensing histidine kinase KdpD
MKDDLQAIAFLFCSIALIMLTTLLFSAAAQWLSGVAYRLGLVSNAAQWTIYVMGLLLCIATMLTVAGRVVDGRWWFR